MNCTTLGIDLAKQVFQLHGVDERGQVVVQQRVSRGKLWETVAQLPPCLIGMEACSSSQYWAREFQQLGHTAKLISPQFVKPYVKGNKNDRRDAEAICEAVSRPPHAVRAAQDGRESRYPSDPPDAQSTGQGANRPGQPNPRPAGQTCATIGASPQRARGHHVP